MTTKYIAHFLFQFAGLFPAYTFMIGCGVLWSQTYRISSGHDWLGKLAMLSLLIFDIILTMTPDQAVNFRSFRDICMTAWVIYNGWYFYRYPIPWYLLQADSAERPQPIYKPRTKLGTRLIRPVAKESFFTSRTFRWLAAGFFFLLISAYFIQKLAVLAVNSDNRVIAAQTNADSVATVAVQVAKKETKRLVAGAVDTLTKGQLSIVATARSAFKKVDSLSKKVSKTEANQRAVNQRATRAEAKADRALNSTVIPVAPLRPVGPSGLIPTNKVQSVPPIRKGKYGFDYEEEADDSTFYVRRYE